jgi:hypothetical protein
MNVDFELAKLRQKRLGCQKGEMISYAPQFGTPHSLTGIIKLWRCHFTVADAMLSAATCSISQTPQRVVTYTVDSSLFLVGDYE